MNIVRLVIAFLMSFTQFLAPYAQFALHGGTDYLFEDWSADSAYSADYAVELQKDPAKDFVVLNLADIQLSPDLVFAEAGEYTEDMLTRLINETNPDLITLTGDNSTSDVGYMRLIEFLDSFKIPWAPVMGNHDGGNGAKLHEGWDAYLLSQSEYCLFKFGPKGMGYGNYIINITENGKVIHSLFMMDSHSSADDTEASRINRGPNGESGYDFFWANQLDWYEWAVKGIAQTAGNTVQSSVFMHIPPIETRYARDLMCVNVSPDPNGTDYQLKEEYRDGNFGSLTEGVCSPEGNNGFFDLALSLGSTKDMIYGHDHVNSLSVVYKGIRLSYGLKSSHGSYWNADFMGGSLLSIHSDGTTTFAHHFMDMQPA